jgi:threonine/homoserine/homoserine lactone efflux protein
MLQAIKTFTAALAISFLGSLPIGTLSAGVVHYQLKAGWLAALQFGMAAIVMELVMVMVALIAVEKLAAHKKLFPVFRWVGIVLMLTVAILLVLNNGSNGASANEDGQGFANPFIAGFVLSLINPLHIPFWIGWSVVLRTRGWLHDGFGFSMLFGTGAAIGTAVALLLYALFGKWLVQTWHVSQWYIHVAVACMLAGTAFYHLYKLMIARRQQKFMPAQSGSITQS